MDAAEECGFNIRGAEIINPENYEKMDEMVEMLCEIRKKKGMTPEMAREVLSQATVSYTHLDTVWKECWKVNQEHFYHVGAKESNRNSMLEALLMNYNPQNVPAMKKNEESYIQMSFLYEVANA